jgi:hypothetical protein
MWIPATGEKGLKTGLDELGKSGKNHSILSAMVNQFNQLLNLLYSKEFVGKPSSVCQLKSGAGSEQGLKWCELAVAAEVFMDNVG